MSDDDAMWREAVSDDLASVFVLVVRRVFFMAGVALVLFIAVLSLPAAAADSFDGKPLFDTVEIEPGHRWYMVIGSDVDGEPLRLIDDVQAIRAGKDLIRYETNALYDLTDYLAAGSYQSWRFTGVQLYRDGERVAGQIVASHNRFDFGPIAKQGFFVITCRATGKRDELRAALQMRETAPWLYPRGAVWFSEEENEKGQFAIFIRPEDQHRVTNWPKLECK